MDLTTFFYARAERWISFDILEKVRENEHVFYAWGVKTDLATF
jgi:hypothetical protein